MTTFIMTGKYSSEAVKKISGERTTQATQIIKECGGNTIAVYATLGEGDILAIVEFPGINELIKASIGLNEALGISFASVPALPIEDFDKLVGGRP